MRIPKHPSNDFGKEEYHRMQVRMSKSLHRYLEGLSFQSQLDIAQLIRLLIYLAPRNEEFNRVVESYIRPDRRAFIMMPDFNNENLWKRC